MSKENSIEIELKFPLLNKETVIEKLNSLGVMEKQESQKDTYYLPPNKNFLDANPISEWLRLRESSSKFTITYKKWHNTQGKNAVSCDEFETKIDDLSALKNILANLDFKAIIVVDKLRRSWQHNQTEISIDEVKDLGDFIELEAKGDFSSVTEAERHMKNILKQLGAEIQEQDYEGYPYRLLKKKGLV